MVLSNKILATALITSSLFSISQAEDLSLKYMKLKNLTYKSLMSKDRDGKVIQEWFFKNRTNLSLFSGIEEIWGLKSLIPFYKISCTKDLNFKNYTYYNVEKLRKKRIAHLPYIEKDCLVKEARINVNHKFKEYLYDNRMKVQFRQNPSIFTIDKKIAIITFNLEDSFYEKRSVNDNLKIELKSLSKAIRDISKVVDIPLSNLVIVGSFGVSAKTLNYFLNDKEFEILVDKGSVIKEYKKGKYSLYPTEHIIRFKGSKVIKDYKIDYGIQFIKEDYYRSKDKNLNTKNFKEKVNPYYPILINIHY